MASGRSQPRGRKLTSSRLLGTDVATSDSRAFYDAIAPTYDELFEAPHRAAYDELAWELIRDSLPATPARIVDVGCGTGRWSSRLVELGHSVLGIEPSPAMARIVRTRMPTPQFHLIEQPLEEVSVVGEQVDLVIALGSLQYMPIPERAIQQMASWLRPGGSLYVLVDSFNALLLELLAAGKYEEAKQRRESRRAVWSLGGLQVAYHLLDSTSLRDGLKAAGLTDVTIRGLLIGSSLFGREGITHRLRSDTEGQMAYERLLASVLPLADLGKHLLGYARRAM
jgi:SAM-dependent methyltransferase